MWRVLAVVALLAACGSGPDCKDAITRAAKRFGTGDAPEVSTLVGECVTTAWPKSVRACVADATTEDALVACMPALDVVVPRTEPQPSASTKALAATANVKALLFDGGDSELRKLIAAYFKTAGIPFELHDRIKDAGLATQYKVTLDNTVVLVRDTQSQTITLAGDAEMADKTGKLRRFDREVGHALHLLTRPVRVAYLVAGHGEITDRASVPPDLLSTVSERKTTTLAKRIAALNFGVKSLAPAELAADVPADATVVLLLAPTVALAAGEVAALQRYLDRGGALFVALDPTAPNALDHLAPTLGVAFDAGHLTDDKAFLPQRKTAADHRFVVTNSFSAHPMTTPLYRATGKSLVLIDAGTLTKVASSPAKVVFTIKSQDSSFIDRNQNFTFDGNEQRKQYDVAAAIEGAKFRAAVFADVDLFADVLVANTTGQPVVMMISGALLDDTLRWLAGEEVFAGDIVEDDGDSSSTQTKTQLSAELELTKRRILRALARTIAAKRPDDVAGEVHRLQAQQSELQQRLDKAK
jgi:hypothetical protein